MMNYIREQNKHLLNSK